MHSLQARTAATNSALHSTTLRHDVPSLLPHRSWTGRNAGSRPNLSRRSHRLGLVVAATGTLQLSEDGFQIPPSASSVSNALLSNLPCLGTLLSPLAECRPCPPLHDKLLPPTVCIQILCLRPGVQTPTPPSPSSGLLQGLKRCLTLSNSALVLSTPRVANRPRTPTHLPWPK